MLDCTFCENCPHFYDDPEYCDICEENDYDDELYQYGHRGKPYPNLYDDWDDEEGLNDSWIDNII
jgi:hypothetical protein